MPGISQATGENYGGIARLYFALQRDIAALWDFDYERDDLQISQANLDAYFSRLRFTRRTANWDYDKRPGAGATEYNNVIEASFAQEREEIRTHLSATEDSQLCFIWKSHNGQWYILPYAVESTAFRSGKEPKDTNGSTFTWSALLPYPAQALTII